MLDGAASEPQSLGDAYRRIITAERALRAFGAPASMLDLTETAARQWHALRTDLDIARRTLEVVAQRIRNERLEFFE